VSSASLAQRLQRTSYSVLQRSTTKIYSRMRGCANSTSRSCGRLHDMRTTSDCRVNRSADGSRLLLVFAE